MLRYSQRLSVVDIDMGMDEGSLVHYSITNYLWTFLESIVAMIIHTPNHNLIK